jgi:membrane fusion protein, multidrug efflux system
MGSAAPHSQSGISASTGRRQTILRSMHCFLLAATLISACKEENKLVTPPPAMVGVARPLQQAVTPYLQATGSAVALNSTDLMARVSGYLTLINYRDGALVKRGDVLFVIEQTEYQAKLQQAQAALASSQAQFVQADAEFSRQSTLGRETYASRSDVDQARAQRDSLRATISGQQAGVTLAQLDLGYTRVVAPFDGIASAHLQSIGSLVGVGGPTKLTTVVQLDPIYVTFTISEQDALRIRAELARRGLTIRDINAIPVEVGLMNEEGYPHRGTLDYVTPQFDTASGTITARAILENPNAKLIPGNFVRVQVPTGQPQTALLVPDQALGTDQGGRYLLTLNQANIVEQRRVRTGAQIGALRVIENGLSVDDRIVVARLQHAVPGNKIEPQVVEIATLVAGD